MPHAQVELHFSLRPVKKLPFIPLAGLLAVPCCAQCPVPASEAVPTVVLSLAAPAPVGPYSQVICAGHTVHVSGQFPLNAAMGQLVGGCDLNAEIHQVLKNLVVVLTSAYAMWSSAAFV